jgi:hypothetical protein
MLPGQLRFIPRLVDKLWRVYDRGNASYPYRTPELGEVVQDVEKEAEAQAEADRLEALVKPKEADKKQKPAAKKRSGKSIQLPDVAAGDGDLLEAPEAYEMDEEAKKKYTEGLFEDVKY